MIPLEEFQCENNTQQRIREQYWINQLKPDLNCRASYSEKTIAEYQKEYYEANAEKIIEQNKEYYEANAKKIIEQKKEYYEANAEKIREYQKKWYEANAEKIKEQISKKYTCECGVICSHINKSRHEKSKKHQAHLKLQNITLEHPL
jgi:hypothetical protein